MDDLRDLYQDVILDHSRRPRNFGRPAWASRRARGYNPICGDQLEVFFTVEPGEGAKASFEGKGCAICLASASMMTEAVAGRSEDQVRRLFDEVRSLCTEEGYEPPPEDAEALESLMALSGVRQYPVRIKCATLAWHALKAALEGETETTTE